MESGPEGFQIFKILFLTVYLLALLVGCDFVRKTKTGSCYKFPHDRDVYKLESPGSYHGDFLNLRTKVTARKKITNVVEVSCLSI